ncbi:hypothetical protein CDCE8392_2165 [Corynebacterium diphtheriae CDCE 8392]|nr:hypothetical protein CDCE8392_2165 [Corynebacterium diphtheriae CDCE 8392]
MRLGVWLRALLRALLRVLLRACEQFLHPKIAFPQEALPKIGLKVQKMLTRRKSS